MASYRDPALDWVPTAGQVVPVDWMQDLTGNDEFFYGDTAWTPATLLNSWTTFAGLAVAYRKIGTRVYLRGAVTGGTIGTNPIFTLPTGYRPPQILNLPTASNSLFGLVAMQTNGNVEPAVGSSAWFALDNISFDTI